MILPSGEASRDRSQSGNRSRSASNISKGGENRGENRGESTPVREREANELITPSGEMSSHIISVSDNTGSSQHTNQ